MILQSIPLSSQFLRSDTEALLSLVRLGICHAVNTTVTTTETSIITHVQRLSRRSLTPLLSTVINTTYPSDFSLPTNRCLIIANHRTRLDPYFILATLPEEVFYKLLPIRLFTANVYLRSWWQRIPLRLTGSFRAYSHPKKISGLHGGLYFSDTGQTLMMFPQGKRVEKDTLSNLKIGPGYLAKHRNFTILPVHIAIKRQGIKRVTVTWNKPFILPEQDRDLSIPEITRTIFKHILAATSTKVV